MSDDTPKKLVDPSNKRKWPIVAFFGLIPLVAVVVIAVVRPGFKSSGPRPGEINWMILKELDLNTGRPSERLFSLDGTRVRAPGFMVPLEDNRAEVTEFLLVPNPQACVHAPAPPSNQMVYVRMVNGPTKMIYGPIWVEGTLRVSPQVHQYGSAGFQMYGDLTEPYTSN